MKELTLRQKQVLGAIGRGLPNKQIADELSISIRTVKEYRQQLHEKLDTGGKRGSLELISANKQMLDRILLGYAGAERSPWDRLTIKEQQAAQLIARGLLDKESAPLLGLSHHTVMSLAKRILRFAGFRNRIELAVYMASEGLIERNLQKILAMAPLGPRSTKEKILGIRAAS